MPDDIPPNDPTAADPAPSQPEVEPRPPRRHIPWRWVLAIALLTPLVTASLYTWIVLTWSYSDGDRAGIVQKFSHKGWLCKTWEGELAMPTYPGVPPQIWEFSVRDAGVAKQINQALGRKVALHYTEHRGVPTTCFGLTRYFVDGLRLVPADSQ
jgi:hypothetical protein